MRNFPPKHIAKPHDYFFRKAMANKKVAREFFETHLPADLKKIVNLNVLELQKTNYIDDMRQESISDTLFKTVMDGQTAFIYLMVDHQSEPDQLIPFRILKYICNVISENLSAGDKCIPFILPLVVITENHLGIIQPILMT